MNNKRQQDMDKKTTTETAMMINIYDLARNLASSALMTELGGVPVKYLQELWDQDGEVVDPVTKQLLNKLEEQYLGYISSYRVK